MHNMPRTYILYNMQCAQYNRSKYIQHTRIISGKSLPSASYFFTTSQYIITSFLSSLLSSLRHPLITDISSLVDEAKGTGVEREREKESGSESERERATAPVLVPPTTQSNLQKQPPARHAHTRTQTCTLYTTAATRERTPYYQTKKKDEQKNEKTKQNGRSPGHRLARQQHQDGLLDAVDLRGDCRVLQVLDDVILRFVRSLVRGGG